jgi:hypothetical protein
MSFCRIRLAGQKLPQIVSAALLLWAFAGCDDSTGFVASLANEIDTVTIYALQLTPIATPSAFDIVNARAARTDRGEVFDFALDFDESNQPSLAPSGALNLNPQPGLQFSDKSFDEIDRPPDDDYIQDRALAVTVGDVLIARSRNSTELCGFFGSLPRYGKFHVLEIDRDERAVTLEFLVNQNCGFRSLELGFPRF